MAALHAMRGLIDTAFTSAMALKAESVALREKHANTSNHYSALVERNRKIHVAIDALMKSNAGQLGATAKLLKASEAETARHPQLLAEYADLQAKIAKANADRDHLVAAEGELKEETVELSRVVAQREADLRAVAQETDALGRHIKELQASITSAHVSLGDTGISLEQARRSERESSAAAAGLESRLAALTADLGRQSLEREASLGRLEAARAALQSARAQEEGLREARAVSERETAAVCAQVRSLEESIALLTAASASAAVALEGARERTGSASAQADAARARQAALLAARDAGAAEYAAVRAAGKRAQAETTAALASAAVLEVEVREGKAALLGARAEARAAREAAQTAAARQSMLKAELAAAHAGIAAAEEEVAALDRLSASPLQASLQGAAAAAVLPPKAARARAGSKGAAPRAGVKRGRVEEAEGEGVPSPQGNPVPPHRAPQPRTAPRAAPAASSRSLGVKLPTFKALSLPAFGLTLPSKAHVAAQEQEGEEEDDLFSSVALGRSRSDGNASAGTSDPVGDDWTRMFQD